MSENAAPGTPATTSPQIAVEQNAIEALALRRAAHYFRDMAQENLSRRRVIEILDWMADEATPATPHEKD